MTLTADEVQLLAELFGKGLIRAPSVARIPKDVQKDMSISDFTTMVANTKDRKKFNIDCCFENLSFVVKVPDHKQQIKTVGTQFMALFNPLSRLLHGCVSDVKEKTVLHSLSGCFQSGRSTLVLGPPGSGVTTLFKALSGRLHHDNNKLKLSGNCYYSGYSGAEMRVKKLSAYVEQLDNHLPTLTVRETLMFAFNCVFDKNNQSEQVNELYKDLPEYAINKYGLTNCADTIIGNVFLRGISGGEKRRVTTAEMLLSRRSLSFYDQISTGLDSAATYDIVRMICIVAKNLGTTPVVSLLQPPPEVVDLFDDVLVLSNGRIFYHGPRNKIVSYFESIGYSCPEDKDIADFVQEVTSECTPEYRTKADAPATIEEMSQVWLNSALAKEGMAKMETLKVKNTESSATDLEQFFSRKANPYAKSYAHDLRLQLTRSWKLFSREVGFIVVRLFQVV